MLHQHPVRMAPVFDGLDDYGTISAHASINDVFSGGAGVGFWMCLFGKEDEFPMPVAKTNGFSSGWYVYLLDNIAGVDARLVFNAFFSTTAGAWFTDIVFEYGKPELHRIIINYDDGSVSNDPEIWINGRSHKVSGGDFTLTELQTPVGSYVTDASHDLIAGALSAGAGLNTLNGPVWDLIVKGSFVSDADIATDWSSNGLPDSDFVGRWKMDGDGSPAPTSANVGTGGVGSCSFTGAEAKPILARFP